MLETLNPLSPAFSEPSSRNTVVVAGWLLTRGRRPHGSIRCAFPRVLLFPHPMVHRPDGQASRVLALPLKGIALDPTLRRWRNIQEVREREASTGQGRAACGPFLRATASSINDPWYLPSGRCHQVLEYDRARPACVRGRRPAQTRELARYRQANASRCSGTPPAKKSSSNSRASSFLVLCGTPSFLRAGLLQTSRAVQGATTARNSRSCREPAVQ